MRVFLWSSASIRGTHLAQFFCTRDACWEFHEEGIQRFEGLSHAVRQESSVYLVEFVRQFVFFKSSVMRDERPDRSSSWTFVLPSLNTRRHFLTVDSIIKPSPYTAVSCLWMSIARTFCAFKKRITDRTSQSAGLSIFLLILNSQKSV
jgi:hypothetical protein